VLRGVSLPKVTTLNLGGPRVRQLRKEDVAGLPAIELLVFANCALEDLAPDIIDACLRIGRVLLNGAPLERDEAKLALLKARWKGVKWDSCS